MDEPQYPSSNFMEPSHGGMPNEKAQSLLPNYKDLLFNNDPPMQRPNVPQFEPPKMTAPP